MEENQTQASSSIKVVKFSSGEEVVSMVIEEENEVFLSNPAKIVVYTSSNELGQVIECLRLTSYLANIKDKGITVLKNYVMYIAEPSEEIQKMYGAYMAFMAGLEETSTSAQLEPETDSMETAWKLFSDAEFVDFLQELYEENTIDLDMIEEEAEEEVEEEWKEKIEKPIPPKAKKKKKYKKENLQLPYNPDGDIKDPKSWSDNPEDYLK